MSETTGEIAAALAEFQSEMPVVPKNKTAAVGTYSYKYADLADVTAAAMPVLHRNGLSFSACPRRSDHGYELVGLLLHTSGESLHGALPIHGNKPQEIGSALTYARRYLLGCMTGLVTDDDDDARQANHAPRTEPKMTSKTRAELEALFRQKGVVGEAQLVGVNALTGASYTSLSDMTEDHARVVCVALLQRPDYVPPQLPAGGEGSSEGEASEPEPPAGDDSPGNLAAGVEKGGEGPDEPSPPQAERRGPRKASRAQHRMIFATLKDLGVDDDRAERLLITSTIVGRTIESFDDLTVGDATRIVDALAKVTDKAGLNDLLDAYEDAK